MSQKQKLNVNERGKKKPTRDLLQRVIKEEEKAQTDFSSVSSEPPLSMDSNAGALTQDEHEGETEFSSESDEDMFIPFIPPKSSHKQHISIKSLMSASLKNQPKEVKNKIKEFLTSTPTPTIAEWSQFWSGLENNEPTASTSSASKVKSVKTERVKKDAECSASKATTKDDDNSSDTINLRNRKIHRSLSNLSDRDQTE